MRILSIVVTLAVAAPVFAQGKAPAGKPDPAAAANPISFSMGKMYERTKKLLTAAAAEMPAEKYSWKPTPEVRSYGSVVGHVVDASYTLCSVAKKEQPQKRESAEKLTTKAEFEKALKDAFAFCDPVYAESTDATLASVMVPLFGQQVPKFAALDINLAHYNEHYGTLSTYLRMNKLVPPSSQGQGH
jgi:hypothetical protein